MKKSNYWLKSGLINLFQNLISVLLGFFSFYILVRILSKDEYGSWVLFLSVVSIIEMGRNGLTQEALVKFLSSSSIEDKRLITTATFIINIVLTIIIILLLFIFGPVLGNSWNAPEINTMFQLYILVFLFLGILNQLNCIEQANLNFTGIFYSTILRQAIFFGYVFFCYFMSYKTTIIFLTYVQIISIIAATVVALLYTRKNISFSKTIDVSWIKKILHFGKYTFSISLSTILAGSIDQMMLGSMLSKTASGSYNIAVRVTNLTDIPTNAMVSIVYPQSSIKIAKEGDASVKYLYEKSVGVILAILVPVVITMILFADMIIPLIAGEKYTDSIPLLKVTLLGTLFAPYGRQAGVILNSAGKTKFNFIIVIATASLIIAFNFFFIGWFGVIGAAYATLLATIISFIVSQAYMQKHYKINIFNPWIYAFHFYPEFYKKYILKQKDK